MFRGKAVTLHSQNGNGASLRGRPGFTGMPKDIDSDATGQRKQRGFRAVPSWGGFCGGPRQHRKAGTDNSRDSSQDGNINSGEFDPGSG